MIRKCVQSSNSLRVMTSSSSISLLVGMMIATSIVVSGCSNPHPIIQKMESAYSQRKSQDDVSIVVKSALPIGTDAQAAYKYFNELRETGFAVKEYKREGMALWPEGPLLPYTDQAMKRQMENRLAPNVSEFVLEVSFGSRLTPVTKTAAIVVRIEGGVVTASSGRINVSFI
jgi:hypothetical protein